MLIIARGFQGLGGALVSPAALAIITTTFAEGPERTKALSIWGGIAAGGAAFGLLLGGFLTQTLSWEWNFIVNVPVGILVIIAALRLVPESRQEQPEGVKRHFDVGGATTVTSGLMVLVYTIVKAPEWGWLSATTFLWAAGGLALLGAFLFIESRSPNPLVRLSFFSMRWITVSNLTMFVVAGGMFGMFYFASLYVQEVFGYEPFKAGLAFLPVSLGIMVGAGLSQQFIAKVGIKPFVMVGMTLAATGLIILAATTAVDGTYLQLLAGLAPMSIGMGMTFVPLTLIATAGVDRQDAGLASGLFNTSQQVGGALGLAILASLASSKTSSIVDGVTGKLAVVQQQTALVEGFQVAFIAAAILMVSGLVMVSFFLRSSEVAHVHLAGEGEAIPVPA